MVKCSFQVLFNTQLLHLVAKTAFQMTSTLHMGQWVLLPGIIPVTEVYLELAVSAPAALWGLQMKKKSLEQGFGHLPQMLLLREWLGPSRHSWEIQKQNEEILCEKKKPQAWCRSY